MRPLTNDIPKPMLKVAGKPILEHILDDLPEQIDEVIIVVGYLKESIMDYFGDKFKSFSIKYVIQAEKLGTFDALRMCEDLIGNDERFLMMYADDLHGAENLKKCTDSDSSAMLVYEAEDPTRFGVVEIDENGYITGIEEKPEHPKSNLVSIGVILLDKDIFKFPARRHPNGEFYLTDSIEQMIEHGYKFKAVQSSMWIPIGYPKDLIKAEKALIKSD